MKTWKCPLCGDPVEISYDWLAEHGNPVCPKCDCEMELVAVADQIERLTAKADAAGLEAVDLDETVHELAAGIASEANNGGLDTQIEYLVGQMGVRGTEQQLDRLIEEKTGRADNDS